MPDSRLPDAVAGVVAAMPDSIWRANQMGAYRTPTAPTGFAQLDAELPNGGWPRSALTELLVQQHGIGEMHLLAGALGPLSRTRRIALVQPPHVPQAMACDALDIDAGKLLWIKTARSADALWATEQLLDAGDACGAIILWQNLVRADSLRRLNLAAQGADTYFWIVRPIAARPDPSPAPLRLALRPARAGVMVEMVKRRGPSLDEPFYLPLADMPAIDIPETDHALLDRRVPATATPRSTPALLV